MTSELIVPYGRLRAPLLELLAGGGAPLCAIQTLSAGVDWLIGKVPDHIAVYNARGGSLAC